MLGLEAKGWMQSLSVVEASPLHRPNAPSHRLVAHEAGTTSVLIRQMYIKDFIQGHIKQTKVRIIRADTYENCPASSAVTRARAGHTQPPLPSSRQ